MNINFVKKGNLSTYAEGTVYFDSSAHVIKVGTGTNRYITYSGVRSAEYDNSTNVLTIINQDGEELEIDLNTSSGDALPAVDSSDNYKILQVINGAWTLVTPNAIYSGNAAPNNAQGNNGDIYIQSQS